MGKLYLVSTPIGNLEDLTLRALRVLGEVDAVACEDTRVTRKIFERHAVRPPREIFSCNEHNERASLGRILAVLEAGGSVALCSDAGTPGISDPGFRLVGAIAERGHAVEALPGPSAVHTALVLSGLPTSSYTFKGFPPRKDGKRRAFLAEELDRPHTLVFFESPFRIGRLLAAAREVYGRRQAAVCIELTKKFERVERGYLDELAEKFSGAKVKGEVTLVVAGNHPKFARDITDADADGDPDIGHACGGSEEE